MTTSETSRVSVDGYPGPPRASVTQRPKSSPGIREIFVHGRDVDRGSQLSTRSRGGRQAPLRGGRPHRPCPAGAARRPVWRGRRAGHDAGFSWFGTLRILTWRPSIGFSPPTSVPLFLVAALAPRWRPGIWQHHQPRSIKDVLRVAAGRRTSPMRLWAWLSIAGRRTFMGNGKRLPVNSQP